MLRREEKLWKFLVEYSEESPLLAPEYFWLRFVLTFLEEGPFFHSEGSLGVLFLIKGLLMTGFGSL